MHKRRRKKEKERKLLQKTTKLTLNLMLINYACLTLSPSTWNGPTPEGLKKPFQTGYGWEVSWRTHMTEKPCSSSRHTRKTHTLLRRLSLSHTHTHTLAKPWEQPEATLRINVRLQWPPLGMAVLARPLITTPAPSHTAISWSHYPINYYSHQESHLGRSLRLGSSPSLPAGVWVIQKSIRDVKTTNWSNKYSPSLSR